LVDCPAGLVTVTVRDPVPALPWIVNVAVSEVGLCTTTLLTPTRDPEIPTVVPALVKLVPVIVTVKPPPPRACVFGLSDAIVGRGGLVTANVVVALPVCVVTVTVREFIVAVGPIVRVAVIVVELTTVTPLTLTLLPDTATDVPGLTKLVPVMVTATLLPRCPDVGLIEVTVGARSEAPVSDTGEPTTDRLAAMLTLPVTAPGVAGPVKRMMIVQLPCSTVNVAPHVPPAAPAGLANEPPPVGKVTAIPVNGPPPGLLSVNVIELVPPGST